MKASFLIDTNVLSELMRVQPDERVLKWLERQADTELFTSSITKAEIFLGIAVLQQGKRRTHLEAAAYVMFTEDFSGRCLPFDSQSAEVYAQIVANRQRLGKPITTEDAQIAAIALTANHTLVTRNTKDFVEINGLKLVNPWESD
ncbi:type II toxin-antitoxin system VapC family toxin [Chlorobaculum thiosulfatiphilum]|uniref:Ribonuclease VapC n=1 Tax=Chlorobaculum thiosulfatiphilum TaxID=115852 RepID=A0A5C4S5Y9_CHLTI|nr:type II toxin-antitoxin system VapC family toxin [Chlorobaculum thiosulfatiphilum]TNJ38874.1 type II toxin-antitoxin system VapC family toxin [Chlorobaculum thiosulfatiphilum]